MPSGPVVSALAVMLHCPTNHNGPPFEKDEHRNRPNYAMGFFYSGCQPEEQYGQSQILQVVAKEACRSNGRAVSNLRFGTGCIWNIGAIAMANVLQFLPSMANSGGRQYGVIAIVIL
jgi:hypothetical protein